MSESIILRRKVDRGSKRGPLAFSGLDDITIANDAISERVSSAMQNSLHNDQYKLSLFGHQDMKVGDCQYYLRVKHTFCGDLMFDQLVELNGSHYIWGE